MENRYTQSLKLLETVVTDNSNIKDYLVNPDSLNTFIESNNVKIGFSQIEDAYSLHNNAISQLSNKLGLPNAYMVNLHNGEQWQKELFTENVNLHLIHNNQKPVLLRTVNSQLKGYLSNSFERYNSIRVLGQFLESFKLNGMELREVYYDGITHFIELNNKNNLIMINNQPHYFGVQYRNSDFGRSALSLEIMLIKQICSNGMVMKNKLRQVHKSRTIEIGESFVLSADTMEKETQAKLSLIKDVANHLCSEEVQKEIVDIYTKASEVETEPEKVFKVLENIGASKGDIDFIQNLLIENNPNTGVVEGGIVVRTANAVSYMGNNISLDNAENVNRYKEMSGKLLQHFVS